MAYDPKRPRPQVASESQVDALIEPVTPVVEPLAVVPPVVDETAGAAPTGPGSAQSADRPATPVAPAPAEGSANRAVVAVAVAAVLAVVALVLFRRRRRG